MSSVIVEHSDLAGSTEDDHEISYSVLPLSEPI